MANEPSKWSHWTPERHADEAQRLSEARGTAEGVRGNLAQAQIHATLAVAKMTDRLDSTLVEVKNEMLRSAR